MYEVAQYDFVECELSEEFNTSLETRCSSDDQVTKVWSDETGWELVRKSLHAEEVLRGEETTWKISGDAEP